VYDLKLTDALLGSFENDPASKGIETALTFHYDQASLTDASGHTAFFQTTIDNTAALLTNFMASSNPGSGSQTSSVFGPLSQQDHFGGS
jgi:hypothetical protein